MISTMTEIVRAIDVGVTVGGCCYDADYFHANTGNPTAVCVT